MIPSIAVFLDLEKAFDLIEWDFIQDITLGARGFFLSLGATELRGEAAKACAKRQEKNLWHQRITTSLPLILETQQAGFTHVE